jgi:hypothetical protein
MCSWRWEKNLIETVFCSCTVTKILVMYSQKRNWAASVSISTLMCLWAIYIFPGSVHIFSCSRIGRLIVGLYKSLTDTWMWKLGLRMRNSIFFLEFSVLWLCCVLFEMSDVKTKPQQQQSTEENPYNNSKEKHWQDSNLQSQDTVQSLVQ